MLGNLLAMVRDQHYSSLWGGAHGSLPIRGLTSRRDGSMVHSAFWMSLKRIYEDILLEVLRRTGWRPTISYGQDVAGRLVLARKEAKPA